MKNIFYYIFNIIISPSQTYKELSVEPKRVKYAAVILIVLEFLFILMVVGYTLSQTKLFFTNFLRIPLDAQSFWAIFLTLPVTFLALIMVSGVNRLSCELFKGKGKFEDVFLLTLISITLPFYVIWLFDTIMLLLVIILKNYPDLCISKIILNDFYRSLLNLIYMIPTLLWNIILLSKSILIAEKIKKRQALIIAVFSALLFWGTVFIFLL